LIALGRYNNRMQTKADVLIIGGGVIGLTTACYLARDGVKVTLLDRTTPGSEASWAGAGIIPPGNPERAATAYDRLRATSSRAFPTLTAELNELTGIDNGYRVCGGIEVFESPAPEVLSVWQAEGIDFRPLTEGDVRKLEPQMQARGDVFHLPGMAQVRNPWHLRALVEACQRLGVQIKADVPVVRFRTAANRVATAVAESGEEYPADRFLIATGAWADRMLAQLGWRTGIHPVRGQIVLYHPPAPLLRHVVCVEKRYLVPREDSRILVGSTEEPEAGFEKRTTGTGVVGLMQFAADVVPALAQSPVDKSWAGLRPGSPDGMPHLGPIPGWSNAFVAAGHHRAGIQLSPATGQLMANLLQGRSPAMSLEPFRPDRPHGPPMATAFRS
jgi:glycine oxidase